MEIPEIPPDVKKQKIIFSLIVNSIVVSGCGINIFYLRYAYMNEVDIVIQVYVTVLFLALITFTYFKASLTTPEQTNVDQYFNMTVDNINKNYQNTSIINLDSYNYAKCQFCNKIKFERSSHCRTCKICVSRRDHHCVWIGNCVGINNNQYFINFCVWACLGIIAFSYNFMSYCWNYQLITEKYQFLKTGYLIEIPLFLICLVIVSFFSYISSIIGKQLLFTINDFTYVERIKAFNTETHYCFLMEDNVYKMPNTYNKGFLTHFFHVIGPTIFHFFFPIPKFNLASPIIETTTIFKKVKSPHTFEVHRNLKNIELPEFKEMWDIQLKSMDPNNFIQLAIKNYGDKKII